jgi:pre-mRNA-processing factor SLU7
MHLERNGGDVIASGKGKRKADVAADDDEDARRGQDGAAAKRRLGEGDIRLDENKLERSLQEEEKRLRTDTDDRARGYNSLHTKDVTEEDIEAYRRKRTGYEDPMANVGNDELLPL